MDAKLKYNQKILIELILDCQEENGIFLNGVKMVG
jgi:hypothetical protein